MTSYYGWSNKQTWVYSMYHPDLNSYIVSSPEEFSSPLKLTSYLGKELDALVHSVDIPLFLSELLIDSASEIDIESIVEDCSFPFLIFDNENDINEEDFFNIDSPNEVSLDKLLLASFDYTRYKYTLTFREL